MTPLYIEIGMHYHCRCDEFPRIEAPACKQAIADFVNCGLLRLIPTNHRNYEPTAALKVWVEALCAVPFPVQQWVIPESKP